MKYQALLALSSLTLLVTYVSWLKFHENVHHKPQSEAYYGLVALDLCGCKRSQRIIKESSNPYDGTTCSRQSYLRGAHQRVIGYTFYGNVDLDISKSKEYFTGIEANLNLIPQYFPGWIMRLYCDLDKEDPVLKDLCELACKNELIDICNIQFLPGTPLFNASKVFAMNWRFFPTLDPQVDLFISRDLDSQFSDREKAAVQEWLDSDRDFHVMRDHPQHGTEILGGTWGCKLDKDRVRSKWKSTWRKALGDAIVFAKRNQKGPDQTFLTRYVWPWVKRKSMAHDSYTCKRYPYTRGFPTQRKNSTNNFVGSVIQENHKLWTPCPVECRPEDHKDWVHC